MKPVTSVELEARPNLREFILLCGKDSVGKSCSVVAMAWYVEQTNPSAKFYVIDTENKFPAAFKSFGSDCPKNIIYYKCNDMNAVTDALADIMGKYQPFDWVAVESMSRIWERAQDMGYQFIVGTDKLNYLEKRRATPKGQKAPPVTPDPDKLWSYIKGAHDSAFLDILSQTDDLNVILTTTIAKPPKSDGFLKENADRKALRVELGMDAGVEGAPRLPYYVETLCLLELKDGHVSCRVLRDNISTNDDTRKTFEIEDRKAFGTNFYSECR